jgi:hypothetical protein
MKAISQAIFTKCAVGTSLYTALGGRIYKGRAPSAAAYPYCVFMLVTDVPGNIWAANIQDSRWQFSLFSTTSGSTEVEDLYTYLKALYDDCALTVTGATHVRMVRDNALLMNDEITTTAGTTQLWHYAVDYNVMTVKTS